MDHRQDERPVLTLARDVHSQQVAAARQVRAAIALDQISAAVVEQRLERNEGRRRATGDYQRLFGLLIAPDRTALRTSSIVARPPGAVPPHSNRVAAGVQ